MSVFVNRNHEMRLIDNSFQMLLDKKELVRNPILEFYGVSGIGKTLLLEEIKKRCLSIHLPYIWIDLVTKKDSFHSEIIRQVKDYLQRDDGDFEKSAVSAIKALLQQGPVIMLFDAIDEVNASQMQEIEVLLRDLIDDEKLFVVLASKTMVEFKNERSVTRKLEWRTLAPLDRDSCKEYLDKLEQQLTAPEQPMDTEIRDLIFAWTQGYPLAMNVMIKAINDGNDPRTEPGKQKIVELLKERVIDQEILKGLKGEWKEKCFTELRLFSVSRRLNLIIMEELIKQFAPNLRRESSLAYFSLPKELHETTHVLSWNLGRSGYAVETPVRELFLLLYSSMQPQEYLDVHDFLAQLNYQLANETTGQDRIRYAHEYLYHLASNPSLPDQGQKIIEATETILREQPGLLQQFFEEFARDQELKEALGPHLASVELAIDKRIAQIERDS